MKAFKWNPFEHEYSEYLLPYGAAKHSSELVDYVACASCGRGVMYGLSFSSIEIHDDMGLGYAVCGRCHELELSRRIAAEMCMSREELEAMTMGELKALAKDIGCSIGYSAARKSSVVDEIMLYQRHVAMERLGTARTMPERHR